MTTKNAIEAAIPMIKNLQIRNFKSIKNLDLECERINLFIGEPNTGKSNILETLGILSFSKYGSITDFVRIESMSDLFYDENLDEKITISADDTVLEITFDKERFIGRCFKKELSEKVLFSFDFDYNGRGNVNYGDAVIPIKFYKFSPLKEFRQKDAEFLRPPFGENLYTVLRTHKNSREEAIKIFEPLGLKLVFRHQESKIEIMKQQEDFIVTYPYYLASDTLQRIVFYATAINSNKDSILVFEEPESHTFPYHTKSLGEKIAFDDTNQYFIATHNPYLLLAILEKAKKSSVNVFVTYFKDYQTEVKRLTPKQISELMNYDPFFNLEAFIEEDKE
jgi:AAA15 family ATPase/GTPase